MTSLKAKHKRSIYERLEKKSQLSYEKTAARMRLALQIDQALKDRGMNQKQLAEILGKKESVITRWMSGTQNFELDTLTEISSVLGDIFSLKPTDKWLPLENNTYKALTFRLVSTRTDKTKRNISKPTLKPKFTTLHFFNSRSVEYLNKPALV